MEKGRRGEGEGTKIALEYCNVKEAKSLGGGAFKGLHNFMR